MVETQFKRVHMVESKMRVGIRAMETMVQEEKKGMEGMFVDRKTTANACENATEVARSPWRDGNDQFAIIPEDHQTQVQDSLGK